MAMHATSAAKSGGLHTMAGKDDGKLTAVKAPPLNMDRASGSRGKSGGKHAAHHRGGHHLAGARHMRAR